MAPDGKAPWRWPATVDPPKDPPWPDIASHPADGTTREKSVPDKGAQNRLICAFPSKYRQPTAKAHSRSIDPFPCTRDAVAYVTLRIQPRPATCREISALPASAGDRKCVLGDNAESAGIWQGVRTRRLSGRLGRLVTCPDRPIRVLARVPLSNSGAGRSAQCRYPPVMVALGWGGWIWGGWVRSLPPSLIAGGRGREPVVVRGVV